MILIATELRNRQGSASRVSPPQATQLINKENAIVIDLRDDLAYKKGHIIGAWHILPAQLLTHDKLLQQKTTPILLTCQNGFQSPALGGQLRKLGFTSVYCLAGGIDNWINSGLLLVKGK
ncbi:MAG TPA: rhodanese-like domain-containing protein, partial [Gammaproteobacteria bacterium]|nr:rhodanese-like domain-containing protein [Gammaproteobacteria bacterium]